MRRAITGGDLIDWLTEAGICTRDDLARRVVIDAKAGDVVVIYIERLGDDRMLTVNRPDLSTATVEWSS